MTPFEELSGLAHYFTALPLYPVFTTVHYILTAFALRNEPGGVQFAQKHPLASCVMTFLVASSGRLLANVALAQPLVESVLNSSEVGTCILVWYLVFFSPLDVCFALCHFVPVKVVLLVLKELARAKKVFTGVRIAARVYPESILAMAVVGMFKGSGKQWGITFYHLLCNPQSARNHELLKISFVTKSAFVLGLLMAYNYMHSIVDDAHLVLFGGCVLVGFILWNMWVRTVDPFLRPQDFTWGLLTSLSVVHPCREVGHVAMETSNTAALPAEDAKSDKDNSKTKAKQHLKHD